MLTVESALKIVGALLTVGSLFYAALQLRQSRKIAKAKCLLNLEELFNHYDEVHTALRPGGKYDNEGQAALKPEDWVKIERYMGLFERVKIFIDDGILDIKTADRLYGYRVINIANNAAIREYKLKKKADSWQDFIALQNLIEQQRNIK